MNFKNMMQALAVALLLATSPVINAAPPVPAMQKLAQQSFAKPEDAARALAEAVRAEDVNALLAVLGPASRSWLASGDAKATRTPTCANGNGPWSLNARHPGSAVTPGGTRASAQTTSQLAVSWEQSSPGDER